MYDPNSVEAKFGEMATREIARILIDDGFTILRADQAGEKGGAALLLAKDGKYPVMDLIVLSGGRVIFIDAKGKYQSIYWRIGKQESHGIDGRNFDQYEEQCKEAGLNGYIAIVELFRETVPFGKRDGRLIESNKLLIYPLNNYDRRESADVASYGKGGMVYWNRNDYIKIYDLNSEFLSKSFKRGCSDGRKECIMEHLPNGKLHRIFTTH